LQAEPNVDLHSSSDYLMMSNVTFQQLSPELLAHVFAYLSVPNKGRAAQVCRAWRDAAYIPSVWRGVEVSRLSPASLLDIYEQRCIRRIRPPYNSSREWIEELADVLPRIKVESLDLIGCGYMANDLCMTLLKLTSKSLTTLRLCHCWSTSFEIIAEECPNLVELVLDRCFPNDFGCIDARKSWRALRKLPRLRLLDLTGVYLDDEFFQCFVDDGPKESGCQHIREAALPLTTLNLENAGALTDIAVKYISQAFPGLVELNLSDYNEITPDGINFLSVLKSLRRLYLPFMQKDCNDTPSNDEGLRSLVRLDILNQLQLLSMQGISDVSMDAIASCTHSR
jgi:F-box and leucine-rich repeat protein 14